MMKSNLEPVSPEPFLMARRSELLAEVSSKDPAAFERFMKEFDDAFPPALQPFFRAYVAGLLSPEPRKSFAFLAEQIGVSRTHLRKLLLDSRWDPRRLENSFRSWVLRNHSGGTAIGMIFETRWRESARVATSTPAPDSGIPSGVQPLPFLVNLGLADGRFRCILESEPYLPGPVRKVSAGSDSRRASQCPAIRPPWKIALALLRQARTQGLRCGWLSLDRSYGSELPFLLGLGELDYQYVAEVPGVLAGWLYPPLALLDVQGQSPGGAESPSLRGRGMERPPHSVRDLTRGFELPETIHIPDLDLPEIVEPWQAGILSFYPAHRELISPSLGLIVLRHKETGDSKYFLTNGAMGRPLSELVRIALVAKPLLKRLKEDAKASGFQRVKVGGIREGHRHRILAALSLLFKAEARTNQVVPARTVPFSATPTDWLEKPGRSG
jgi:hypothetical protein